MVYVGAKELLETITGYQLHQGAMAVGRIPSRPEFETLLTQSPRPLLLAAVEGLPARKISAPSFGIAQRWSALPDCGRNVCSPFQRRAVSGSMGSIFEQPVVQVG